MMLLESKDQLAALHHYYDAGNWEGFTIYIHALKGSCLNIGAQACGESAKALERAGKNKEIPFIHAHFSAFEDEYRSLLQLFEKVLEQFLPQTSPSSSVEEKKLTQDLLLECRVALLDYDFATAAALLRKAHHAPDADLHEKLLHQLDAFMDSMEVEQMISLLPSK